MRAPLEQTHTAVFELVQKLHQLVSWLHGSVPQDDRATALSRLRALEESYPKARKALEITRIRFLYATLAPCTFAGGEARSLHAAVIDRSRAVIHTVLSRSPLFFLMERDEALRCLRDNDWWWKEMRETIKPFDLRDTQVGLEQEFIRASAGTTSRSDNSFESLPRKELGRRCAPMSRSELARRIMNDPNVRPRQVRTFLEQQGLEKVAGSRKYTILLAGLSADVCERLKGGL